MEWNMEKNLVWNGIWDGRFLAWNGNGRKSPVWNMEKSSSIPYHALGRWQRMIITNLFKNIARTKSQSNFQKYGIRMTYPFYLI